MVVHVLLIIIYSVCCCSDVPYNMNPMYNFKFVVPHYKSKINFNNIFCLICPK